MLTINSTFSLNPNLTKTTAIKQELEISSTSHDNYISNLIKRASHAIESYTDRKFERLDFTETLDSEGGKFLLLSRRPVRSITQISLDGSTISSTTYEIDNSHAGIVFRPSGWTKTIINKHFIEPIPQFQGERDWSVRYIAGYYLPNSTVSTAANSTQYLPADLENACIQTVKTWYLERKRNPRIRTQEIGDARESLFAPQGIEGYSLPPSVLDLLRPWREQPFV